MSNYAAHLRSRTRQAIAMGGLPFEESRAHAYLEERFATVSGRATVLCNRFASLSRQDDRVLTSFIEAIPAMTAFADSVVESAYALIGVRETHRAIASRALAAYVIGSSIFDHAADDDHALLSEIALDLTEESLREAVAGANVSFGQHARTPLARAFWSLVRDFAQEADALADARPGTTRLVRERLASVLVGAYRGARGGGQNSRLDVWASPLYVAYILLRLAGDARGPVDPSLEELAEQTGELLRRVDDITDIEDDWASGSRNELLDGMRGSDDPELPWERLLGADELKAHLNRTSELTALVAQMPCADAIGAWLYYWLHS